VPTATFHRTVAFLSTAAVVVLTAADAAAAPSPAARCAKAKLAAVAAAAKATLRCKGRAIVRADPVDPACLTTAQESLAKAFERAEAKGGCASTSDAAALQDDVDLFANLAFLKLAPPAPTPTPGPSPTPTVSPDCANPAHWACCSGFDAPGLGSCSESLVGLFGSPAANTFHNGCTLSGGFSLHARCPTAICGDPAYCCHAGECQAGTTGWFGDVSAAAIQLVCESATAIEPGACP
jgi:hypothetical protein